MIVSGGHHFHCRVALLRIPASAQGFERKKQGGGKLPGYPKLKSGQ
jgi:hypothetical protein